MTTIAAPPRRARPERSARRRDARARTTVRTAASRAASQRARSRRGGRRPFAIGRVGALLARRDGVRTRHRGRVPRGPRAEPDGARSPQRPDHQGAARLRAAPPHRVAARVAAARDPGGGAPRARAARRPREYLYVPTRHCRRPTTDRPPRPSPTGRRRSRALAPSSRDPRGTRRQARTRAPPGARCRARARSPVRRAGPAGARPPATAGRSPARRPPVPGRRRSRSAHPPARCRPSARACSASCS